MHHQYNCQQFSNFTQPPPRIEQTIQSIDDSTIDKFLMERNHLTIQSNEEKIFNHFKISGKNRHVNVIEANLNNLIKKQKLEEINLKNNIAQISPNLWEEKIKLLKLNQIKISELLKQLNELTSNAIDEKPRRKKSNLKKRRQNHCNEKKTNLDETLVKPNQVNLQEKYQMYEIERLRGGNLKRINECKRYLAQLESLIELRCIRRKNSNVCGVSEGAGEKYFLENVNKLKDKWTDALMKCVSLENEFKMSLTSTASVDWLNTLFSKEHDSPFNAPPMDFNQLLDIRKSWDLCLVNDDNIFGSSIPPGWVLPNTTPTQEWASYLIH